MVLTGALHDFDDVRKNGWVDVDGFERFLHGDDLLRGGHLFNDVFVLSSQLSSGEDRLLLSTVRIAHAHLHEETVHLSLWKRVGSFLFNGVLSGDNNKRCRQFVGDSFDGHLLFFHGFKQGCLGLWRGTVDFVSEENVGKQRTGTELEFTGLLVVHVGPHDV